MLIMNVHVLYAQWQNHVNKTEIALFLILFFLKGGPTSSEV